MSEYTTNYELDKYSSYDKPNLRDQYNSAMDKIDTALHETHVDVYEAKATAQRAEQAVAGEVTARTDADTQLQNAIDGVQTALDNEVLARGNADTQIREDFAAADTALRDFVTQTRTEIETEVGLSSNPTSFGADPTGVEDSADAINACIEANHGKTIVFTPGVYRISRPIMTPFKGVDRVSIDFNGSTIQYVGNSQVIAALMVGYSDNPTQADIDGFDFNECSNMQSWYRNFKLVTNNSCDYSIQLQNRYINARFLDFYVVSQTNGINLCEVNSPVHPLDCLISNGYLFCGDFVSSRTGITINGSDNTIERIRSYGFVKHFDINVDGNWFDTIHTLGLSESTISRNNGISFNVAGTNWFHNIYNDAVKTCFYVKDANARMYVDTCMDYTYRDIVGRTLVDCSSLTTAPKYLSIDHANIWILNNKYAGVKLNIDENTGSILNRVNISDVNICDNKFMDSQLAYDDLIRMGVKHGTMTNTGAVTGFKPLGAIVFTDIYKNCNFILSLMDNKTTLVKARVSNDQGNLALAKGDIISSSATLTLGFKKISDSVTGAGSHVYLFGASESNTIAFENMANQACVLLPAYGGEIGTNYGFGTFEPDFTLTI